MAHSTIWASLIKRKERDKQNFLMAQTFSETDVRKYMKFDSPAATVCKIKGLYHFVNITDDIISSKFLPI